MSVPTSSSDRAQPAPARTRPVGPGCAGSLVVLLALFAFFWGVTGLERWLRVATVGADPHAIVIARPEAHANALVWISLVTMIAAVFALNVRSAVTAMVRAGIVLALGAAAIWFSCYGRFEVVRPRDGSRVELRYLWPRPGIVIDASHATVRREVDASPGGETIGPVDYLVVEVDGSSYRSASSGSVEDAKRLLVSRGAREVR